MAADTSKAAWIAAGAPGPSYAQWVAWQGGAGSGSGTGTINYNGSSLEPGLSDPEFVRRKRTEIGPGPIDPQTGRPLGQPTDLADLVLRDASSGKVRKVRGGSTRDSILGQSMNTATMDPNYWASRVMNGGQR